MGKFFFAAAVFSLIWGIAEGKIPEVSKAALEGSFNAVELSLRLLGSLCFWGGIMKVAEKSGLTEVLCKVLAPGLGFVFPKIKNDKKALGAVSMNVAANLLGLGNAATPLGISAMKELHRVSGFSSSATQEMVCFVVMNTASLQLLPTTIASLRMEAGVREPFRILPAVWFASACSLVIGIVVAKATFPKGEGK